MWNWKYIINTDITKNTNILSTLDACSKYAGTLIKKINLYCHIRQEIPEIIDRAWQHKYLKKHHSLHSHWKQYIYRHNHWKVIIKLSIFEKYRYLSIYCNSLLRNSRSPNFHAILCFPLDSTSGIFLGKQNRISLKLGFN